jgi:hypothetical protein
MRAFLFHIIIASPEEKASFHIQIVGKRLLPNYFYFCGQLNIE